MFGNPGKTLQLLNLHTSYTYASIAMLACGAFTFWLPATILTHICFTHIAFCNFASALDLIPEVFRVYHFEHADTMLVSPIDGFRSNPLS